MEKLLLQHGKPQPRPELPEPVGASRSGRFHPFLLFPGRQTAGGRTARPGAHHLCRQPLSGLPALPAAGRRRRTGPPRSGTRQRKAGPPPVGRREPAGKDSPRRVAERGTDGVRRGGRTFHEKQFPMRPDGLQPNQRPMEPGAHRAGAAAPSGGHGGGKREEQGIHDAVELQRKGHQLSAQSAEGVLHGP